MKKKPSGKESDADVRQMNDLLQELLSILQPELAAAVDDPLHQLPPPPYLIGRETELAELAEQIESGIAAGVVLQGPEGLGKTAMALKLAQELATIYDHAQFFIDLRGGQDQQPLAPAEAMARVLHAFHHTKPLPDSEVDLSALYRAALRGRRTLLLLDNAANAAQIEPLVPPAGCVMLATSRREFPLTEPLAAMLAKRVGAMQAVDSRELLLGIAPNVGKHAESLAELCGRLPLALQLAAGALATQKKLTPARYLKRLRERRQSQQPLDAVLSLNDELMPPVPQGLWRELAVFPASFDADAAAAVWDMTLESAWESRPAFVGTVLNHLESRRLLEKNEQTKRYRLHDAARAEAAARLSRDERATVERRHAKHYLSILRTAAIVHKSGNAGIEAGLDLCDRERLNIAAGRAWAAANSASDKEAAEWAVDYFYLGIPVLVLRLGAGEINQWLRDAIQAARAAGDPKKESVLLGELGSAYQDVGRNYLAVECLQRSLAAARRIGDDEGERRALGGLGDAYHALGELGKAIEVYQEYLAIVRQMGDRRLESYLLNNLGAVYGKLHRTRDAMECFGQQLEITRETGDREHEGRVLGNMGVACIDSGETLAAIEHFKQALAVQRKIGNRNAQAEMLGYIGGAYFLTGEMRKAVKLFEQALALYRKLGDRHGAGEVLWNQSLALDQIGERARATQCAEAALKIREELADPRATEIRRRLAKWRGEREPHSGH